MQELGERSRSLEFQVKCGFLWIKYIGLQSRTLILERIHFINFAAKNMNSVALDLAFWHGIPEKFCVFQNKSSLKCIHGQH